MCQLKALAITEEQCIMGFKAYTASVSSSCRQAGANLASSGEWRGVATANDALRLCQVAAGKRVPIWLVAGNGAAWQQLTMHSTRRLRWLLLA